MISIWVQFMTCTKANCDSTLHNQNCSFNLMQRFTFCLLVFAVFSTYRCINVPTELKYSAVCCISSVEHCCISVLYIVVFYSVENCCILVFSVVHFCISSVAIPVLNIVVLCIVVFPVLWPLADLLFSATATNFV